MPHARFSSSRDRNACFIFSCSVKIQSSNLNIKLMCSSRARPASTVQPEELELRTKRGNAARGGRGAEPAHASAAAPERVPLPGCKGFSCLLVSALENSKDVRADLCRAGLCRVENPAHRSASAIFCRFSPAGVFGWSPVPLTFVSFCLR